MGTQFAVDRIRTGGDGCLRAARGRADAAPKGALSPLDPKESSPDVLLPVSGPTGKSKGRKTAGRIALVLGVLLALVLTLVLVFAVRFRSLLDPETFADRLELIGGGESVEWFLTSKWPVYNRREAIIGTAGISRHLNRSEQHSVPYRDLSAPINYIRQHFSGPISVARNSHSYHQGCSTPSSSSRCSSRPAGARRVNGSTIRGR